MANLIIMCGLPASGKTVYAKRHFAWADRISMVDIREELTGDPENQTQNQKVFRIAMQRVRESFKRRKDVVFDATSQQPKARRNLTKMAPPGYRTIIVYMDTPVEECIRRDSARDRHVGEEVIRKMSEILVPPQEIEADRVEYIRPEDMEPSEPETNEVQDSLDASTV